VVVTDLLYSKTHLQWHHWPEGWQSQVLREAPSLCSIGNQRYVVTSVLITVSQFVNIKGVSSGDIVDLGFMVFGGVLGVLASYLSHFRYSVTFT
jgi:hypothetical protein